MSSHYEDNFIGIIEIGINQMQTEEEIKHSYVYLVL